MMVMHLMMVMHVFVDLRQLIISIYAACYNSNLVQAGGNLPGHMVESKFRLEVHISNLDQKREGEFIKGK